MEYERKYEEEKKEMEVFRKRIEEKEYKNNLVADKYQKMDIENKELIEQIKIIRDKLMLSESAYNTILDEKNSVSELI